MHTLEITIQRKTGDGWPVVAEYSKPGAFLPVRSEGELKLDQDELRSQTTPKEYGIMLGKALFRDEILIAFAQARADSEADEEPLRIFLVIETPDLRSIHWERLCAPLKRKRWGFLSQSQRYRFSLYSPSLAERSFQAIGRRDLQALVVVANPAKDNKYKLDTFDAEGTVARIRHALEESNIPHHVLATVAGADGPPTVKALRARLTDQPYTLLHIVAHGWFREDNGETILYLTDANNQVQPITVEKLIDNLYELQNVPHFAFLCTCDSAKPEAEAEGALGGMAQRLVRELGLPAVVAMTEKVSIDTAEALAQAFYIQLLKHGVADQALVEACIEVAEKHDVTVPALYSRLRGRPLFSDANDRDLTETEIKEGLSRLKKEIEKHAPILSKSLETQTKIIQRTLGADTTTARKERGSALIKINDICEEVLDLSFNGLALGQTPPEPDSRCPFPGLRPFGLTDEQENDYREFFFGREQVVEELHQKLTRHLFLAVLGASGSGKSSVVLAGLVPFLQQQALETGQPEPSLIYLTPGSDPVSQLETAMAALDDQPTVIVVDQFEELFTLCTETDKRQTFIKNLLALVDPKSKSKIVITMRADFWGECAPYPNLKAEMQLHQELLAPMDTAELRSAMEQQARKVGLRFEADLSHTILAAVQDEPGAMPLLQHLLQEMWKRRHGRWLLAEEYRALGGIEQAIAHTADELYKQASEVEQEHLRHIFVRLTRLGDEGSSGGDTGRRVTLNDLIPTQEDSAIIRNLVERLANARLVVTSIKEDVNLTEVVVAHEALIRHWPRLREWLDEDRVNLRLHENVRQAALAWQRNAQSNDYLDHTGSRLVQAEALAKQPRFAFNELEQNYLKACKTWREEDKARKRDLSETGWGIIFAADANADLRDALRELLVHRREQATKKYVHYYREFVGGDGFRSGEAAREFLERHKVGSGPVDPNKMPYYLLIVGDPQAIPFEFQYQLAGKYAVGRLHFETLEEYAQYARSVVTVETGRFALPRQAAFFGVENPDDRSTNFSLTHLTEPLVAQIAEDLPNWDVNTVLREQATKVRLGQLLGGDETPALLFTTSHGTQFAKDDSRQIPEQGALVCQDWPGPNQWQGLISQDLYFAANDVAEDARLLGMLVFLWAEFSAGTPATEDFGVSRGRKAESIAPYPFIARLPQRLLGHPNGGALAVIGHVDTLWASSITSGGRTDMAAYFSLCKKLLEGDPVGAAMEVLNQRYLELTATMSNLLIRQMFGEVVVDPHETPKLITAALDARNYIILGDPAVRLKVSEVTHTMTERPTIEPVTFHPRSAKDLSPLQEKPFKSDAHF